MEVAFDKYKRFAKVVVAEPSDWDQVRTLLETNRKFTRDPGEAQERTSVLEFASIAALDRCMKDWDPCQEHPDLRGTV